MTIGYTESTSIWWRVCGIRGELVVVSGIDTRILTRQPSGTETQEAAGAMQCNDKPSV